MEKQRKNSLYIVIILLFLSIIILALVYYINSSQVLDRMEIPASLSIGNKTAFNISKSALSFGTINTGNSASREDINIKNNYDFPIRVEFEVKGDIKPFLIYDKVVYLNPGEEKTIKVHTVIISDEPYGDYSGKMIVVFKRAQ